ncbi:hypothetical protein [Paraburkholderia tagetis]|uniref:Blue (type 1) copper domain-containing protein n=1 Tax=Paraburkholderia tagetis TaxID=2913261 RepID=A0A9X1RV49_9BURK|nr:hypothetical protein [Paraburkholderia tagetis]MCG5076716.1 hypothetical protein [Paraburkholderia tagetis]
MKRNALQAAMTAGLLAVSTGALPAEPSTVTVHLSDGGSKGMSLTLVPSTIPAGPVEFTITNESHTLKHEFMVLPWSGAGTALPYDQKTQQVKEARLGDLQGVEDLNPRETVTARFVLKPGRYIAFCNEPGHYRDAMRATLVVDAAK